mmetsp:Transcript_4818/g.12831  ORF Transcript_4818/g.12831 Transcript_4818/m.12831 type:complete len:207 (-) Transcript_4818:77-697(-)
MPSASFLSPWRRVSAIQGAGRAHSAQLWLLISRSMSPGKHTQTTMVLTSQLGASTTSCAAASASLMYLRARGTFARWRMRGELMRAAVMTMITRTRTAPTDRTVTTTAVARMGMTHGRRCKWESQRSAWWRMARRIAHRHRRQCVRRMPFSVTARPPRATVSLVYEERRHRSACVSCGCALVARREARMEARLPRCQRRLRCPSWI